MLLIKAFFILSNVHLFRQVAAEVLTEEENQTCTQCQAPETATNDTDKTQGTSFKCGIYLAPSSIPNAGFGIYTTRSIAKGEKAQPYPDAPAIPITDYYNFAGNIEQSCNYVDYVWEGSGISPLMAAELSDSVMTYGALSNFHTYLSCLEPDDAGYDDTILDRFSDPGAGAISYNTGRYFVATRDIKAGEELFDNYGESWLDNRQGTYADYVPRENDYTDAAKVLDKMMKRDEDSIDIDSHFPLIIDIVSMFNKRAASTLPKTKDEYEKVMSLLKEQLADKAKVFRTRPNLREKEYAEVLARSGLEHRDMNLIEDNGLCMEKIRTGTSTIAGAGRGAFAQMYMKEGEIVAPAPTVNILDRKSLLTYATKEVDGNIEKLNDDPIGQQLLLNYCFSHQDSKLTLCPQTNAILINHCSDREQGKDLCNGKSPNAKVQWAGDWDPASQEWLKKSYEEVKSLTMKGQRGISFEIVATRDISPGEEVFIDYGVNWENAWLDHVNEWKAPENTDYLHFAKMSGFKDFTSNDDLPSNTELSCYAYSIIEEYGSPYEMEEDENAEMEVVEMDDELFHDITDEDLQNYENRLRCEIVESSDESDKFSVRMFHSDLYSFVVENFPKESMVVQMKRYSSDQHLEGAFRHFIEIDDNIFPEAWKTL